MKHCAHIVHKYSTNILKNNCKNILKNEIINYSTFLLKFLLKITLYTRTNNKNACYKNE